MKLNGVSHSAEHLKGLFKKQTFNIQQNNTDQENRYKHIHYTCIADALK